MSVDSVYCGVLPTCFVPGAVFCSCCPTAPTAPRPESTGTMGDGATAAATGDQREVFLIRNDSAFLLKG